VLSLLPTVFYQKLTTRRQRVKIKTELRINVIPINGEKTASLSIPGKEEMEMSTYLIASKHTPEECLQALDEMMAKGKDTLGKFVFGCKDGDHTGYAIVDAERLSDALSLVPDFLQEEACLTKVSKFTAAEIKSFHAKAA